MNDRSALETIKRVLDDVPDRIHAELWVDANTTLGAFVDMSLAALSHADHGGVEVNALEWDHHEVRAQTGDLYSVGSLSANVWVTYKNGTAFYGWKPTVEAAKAAAQTDYEARILSALTQAPAPPMEYRHEESGYVEFLNEDVATVTREIDGRVAILLELNHPRRVVGYRVYDPDCSPSEVFGAPAPTLTGEVETPAPSPLLEAAKEAFAVQELRDMACKGSDAPAEHALGLLLEEAFPGEEWINIDGHKYRKFIRFPEEVDDETLRCIACGQIDEEEYHDASLCRGCTTPTTEEPRT